MINRILIRIKVIQILYSFLLVEHQFTLEDAPSQPSREKRFAYNLYLDILVLMIKVARAVGHRGGSVLAGTRFIERLLMDDTVKSLLKRYETESFPFDADVEPLAAKIKDSAIYKHFLKNTGNEVSGEEHLWGDIFLHIIASDAALNSRIGKREHYTLKGFESMKESIISTLTRFNASQDNVAEVRKSLRTSLDRANELYYRLLYLPVELTDLQDRILDDNRYKFLKTEADINPDLRFVENSLVAKLRENSKLKGYVEHSKLSWLNEDPVLMRKLLDAVINSDTYRNYMAAPATDDRLDAELWRDLLRRVILVNPALLEALEEKSVFWNDDIEIISSFVDKTFRRFQDPETEVDAVLSQFKDDEDAAFGNELITLVYKNKDEYRKYVEKAVSKGRWDAERLAFMDIVILETAMAEILNFPKIPINVSVNEYIELAKSYSTAKSGAFVHGLLGSIIHDLKGENKLFKN